MVDILNSQNFNELTADVNVDIRNSINHGGAIYKLVDYSSAIDFHYTRGNRPYTLTLRLYEFDKIIDRVYDTASAVLLGICSFINKYFDLSVVNRSDKLSVPFHLLEMSLSIPTMRCISISGLPDDKQLNIDIYIKNPDRDLIFQTAILLSILTFSYYDDYKQYMFIFHNERLQGSWIRFTNQEVENMYKGIVSFDKTIEQVIKRGDLMVWDASIENIDLQEVKYFRFPNHSEEDYKINNIEDASLENIKRLRAHLFIGDISDKNTILAIINKGIEWLKHVKNPPSPTIPHKYGTMGADSLYINVYRNDARGDKELYPRNENFVCMIDYNLSGETTIKHGGIPINIWNQLHHETIGNIRLAWREGKYIARRILKIGANEQCPCGSGKKFKKCCKK